MFVFDMIMAVVLAVVSSAQGFHVVTATATTDIANVSYLTESAYLIWFYFII